MYRVLTTMALFGVLFSGVGPIGSTGHAQAPSCTQTLSPEQSIQNAIDDARRGDVICLKAGTWKENLKITRSVTLRGIGDERSTLRGREEADLKGIVEVSGSTRELRVIRLQHLELLGSQDTGSIRGIHVFGSSLTQSARLIVEDVHIKRTNAGLWVVGPDVSARVERTSIENVGVGIVARRQARLEVAEAVIRKTGVGGIRLNNGVQADVRRTTIRNSGLGASRQGIGIKLGNRSHLRLVDSAVLNNGAAQPDANARALRNAGVAVGVPSLPEFRAVTSASAEIVNSRIDGNRHGIVVGKAADLHMEGSQVRRNLGWGLVAFAQPCLNNPLTQAEALDGQLEFTGRNAIGANNASGQLDGQGNPGIHPFHYLPDGQVCLPR
ncbi:MAG: right-handed parallel beta-helix repeat-containing protein [Candidatus Bipolaricaulia bacterium]